MNWLKQKWLMLVAWLRLAALADAIRTGRADMDMMMGVVRALLAALGGWVANQGWASQEEVTTIIGALLTLIAGIWSIVAKRRASVVNLKPAE